MNIPILAVDPHKPLAAQIPSGYVLALDLAARVAIAMPRAVVAVIGKQS
jgi:hypothetical protein